MSRIGFDIDGVLANFAKSYQNLVVKTTGRDLFQPDDINNPPCWDWPEFRGYSPEEMEKTWAAIRRDDAFWMNLEPFTDNTVTLHQMLRELERKHEIYFVTSRSGMSPKRQTKMWLFENLSYYGIGGEPTVLISSEKGEVAHALKLNAYVDDNFDNAVDVVKRSATTSVYLLNRSYNAIPDWTHPDGDTYTRINTLGQMFDAEIAKGRL